jgi:uncharacterized Tic20 family protein
LREAVILGEKGHMDSPTPSAAGDDRLWGALAHFSALAMYFTGIGHIVGPMIIWLWKRDTSAFAGEEAKEAMNFNISVTIYAAAAAVLCLTIILIPIALMLFGIIHVFQVVCIIIGGLKASDGRPFRYPLNLRLVK